MRKLMVDLLMANIVNFAVRKTAHNQWNTILAQ